MSLRPTPVAARKADPPEPPASEGTSTGTRTGRTEGSTRRRPSRRRSGATPASPAESNRVVQAPQRFRRRLLTWRRVTAALVVLALVLAAGWALFFSSLLTVRHVSVEGTSRQDPVAVKELLTPQLGQPLAKVDLAGAAHRVATLPAVRDVQVTRAWPNGLDVRVVERTPVAVVSSGSGYTLVDANGVKMATTAKVPADLPVMTQATLAAGPGPTLAVSQSLDRLSPAILAKVRTVSAKTQDSVTFTLKSGAVVRWGSSENAEQKSEVLGVLLSKVKAHTYDVRAPDLPVTK